MSEQIKANLLPHDATLILARPALQMLTLYQTLQLLLLTLQSSDVELNLNES